MMNSKYIIFFNSLLFLIQIQLVQSQLTSNGLVLNLDASNSTSYSGIGATWNDISGNNNHFNINTATYNSEGYFVFDGDDSMTGPPSNSFGLSQTDHTIEIILEPVSGGGSVINFRGDSHNYGINAHLPWSSNVIFYDVGGCCDSDVRIEGGPNIVGQKTHVILRSKPSGDSKREVFVNGSSVINSGSSNTSTNNFTSVEATIGGFIYSDGNSHHTNSKIYSVRVYNRALTDQEISNNYNHYLHPNNIPVVNTHVTSGLVMYVDAENDLSYNGSGLSWNDLSGNNNNGTISGASYDSDRKSFDFDGNDDKVSFPAVLSEGDDTYTIEAYFKTDQNNKTQVIWEQNTSVSTSHRRGCMILLSDGEGGFNGQNNDRHDEIDYSAGLWNHWVIAIDNNGGYPQVEMYVNGVLHWQGNQANGGELNLGSHGSAIGYKLSSNGEYFNGEIKSVRIYNRKLNADEIKQNYWSTINRYLVTDGLQLYLDADNFSSFPGTGNFWYDLSQSNYDFTINSDAFRTVDDIKHMDFEGSYGAAQYIVNGSRLNIPSYSNATMQVFTSIKNTTSDHRTLVRGSANDHPVIIQSGNNNLGMHDNDNVGFIDTGFDITSLPNPYTQFNFLDFKLAQSSPYMKFKFNTDSNVYQITDVNANYHRGFHAIGKWFENQNNVNTGHQWWGKIGVFLYYDRELTESETTQNFNAFASRFGLESETDNTAPEIFSSKLKVDNSVVSITFTEAVYNSSNGSGNLEASDFNLTISGGNATLSSSNPSSISIDGSTISLGIPINGTPDGDEILTISPANNAIFDAAGNPASTSQTSNTIQLISDIVTSGLMIYLDASNENSYSGSGSNWYDLTSNGNDGVISGTTFSNDGGGSFEFGSSSDYVEIGDDPSLDMDNNQMTISYLIEIDRTGTGWSPAIEKGSGLNNCGTGNLNYYTWYGNTDLQIDFVGNTNLRGQLYHATIDDFYTGQFRLITITIDQSNVVKTYIDGEIKHTLNHNGQVLGPVTNGPLVIGKCPDPDGKIRSLMIYNRALSSDEVHQNYNSLTNAPKIISTSISVDNSTVSVTFDQSVYNSNSGSGNLETTDFSLSISGGTSTLSSSTPSSISISGDTIELGVPLAGSYDGNEQLTVNLTGYSVFNSIGYNASSQQISNTVSLNNLAPTDISFVPTGVNVEYLVVGGGGGGGGGDVGAGGGAGGFRTNKTGSQSGGGCAAEAPMVITDGTYTVVVGAGGNGGNDSYGWASDGGDSSFNGIISKGGGGAPGWRATNGRAGGSGSGSTGQGGNNPGSGESCQGYNGGTGLGAGNYPQGGGGGAGGSGENAPSQNQAGAGGPGLPNPFQDSNIGQLSGGQRYLAGGGGGGVESNATVGNGGVGGGGIGGRQSPNLDPGNGLPNTGGGGGGEDNQTGGSGGSGVVIIRYLGNPIATGGTITQSAGYTIHTFTQTGNSYLTVSSGSSSSTASFDEGSAVGTVVATLTATDTDSTNLTYSLATGNGTTDQHNSLFTVSGTQLLVASSTISYDTTTSLNVNLKVSDGQNTLTKAFQIAVNDLNRAPTDIGLTSNTITENASPSTVIGTLSSVDLDITNTSTFTLADSGDAQDDDNGSFTISGTSLILNSSPDYETKASYNIYINVNDGANNYAKAFTVSITNINEAPTDLSFEAGSNVITDGLISHLDATNADSYNGLGDQWTDLSGNNNHGTLLNGVSFANNRVKTSNTGTGDRSGVRIGSLPILANDKSWTIVVKVTPRMNSGNILGLSSQSDHAGWNAPVIPTAGGYLYPGIHDSHLQWSHPFNVDQEYEFVYSFNRSNNVNKFYIDGTLINTRTVAVNTDNRSSSYLFLGDDNPGCCADTSRGQSEDHAGDYERFLFYNRVLTDVEVQQLFGSSGSGSGTTTSTASFDEGSAVGTVVATLTATDSDTTNLTYSLVAGNGSNDQHNSLFTVSGNQLLVASSTISYDTTTSLNVYIEVSDGQHTITKAFQIAVNDLNRAPTDIVLTSNTITENASPSTVVGTLSSVDSDTTDTTSFTLATSGDAQDDDNGSFTISGTSLILNFSPDYETKASYNIYINVNDGANNYAKAFTVSVTNINEAPTNIGITSTTINSDAFKFNGTNSYIEIPYAAVNHPAEFTIELWARLDQSTNNFQSPLSSRYGSSPWNNLSGYNFYAVNGLEKWSFTGGSGSWESINTSPTTNEEIYDGNTLKFGIWTHLASTYDGTTYRLYVNGILVGSKTAGYSRVGFNSIPARPLRIGAGRTEGSATYFFNGAVDEVRIWNYARTQSQIDYNKSFNLSGQESGLVSYYQFESGTATNKTGVNGTNGTLYNSPTTVSGIVLFPTSGSNSGTVDEESSIGTLVGYLIANDPDTADLTYSLVSGDGSNDQHNSLFSISGNQLLVAGNIDYETNSTLNIYVQVSDGENTYEKAMIVNVNDIKEVTSIQVNDIVKTFGDADFDLSATSSNTGAFTYTVTDQNIATVNGNTLTIVGAGSTSITVIQAEDDNFASSTATFTLTVNKTDLTISLEDISKTFGDDDFNLSASSSSTGAFTYSVTDQNIATLNGNTLTIVGAGSTSITVSQAADNNYNTASKTINLSVAKGTPVLSFNDVVKNYGDTSFTIEAQSQTSSGSLTFSSSDNSVVSISESTATVNGAGSSIITVTQSETANYNATTTSFTITVNKIDPTLSEFSNVTKTFGDPSFEITPPTKNIDNTGVFTYSSSDPSIVSINNNNLTINGAGSAVLTANLALDNNYNSGSITTNVTVEKANQTISIGVLPENQPLKDFNSIPLSASSSSNAPIIISLDQGSAASLSGNVGNYSLVSIQQTGIVTITFTTDDSNNPNYKTVSTTLSINVVKSNQSVSYSNNPPSQITYSENLSITLGASASSGLAPEYSIVSGDNASLNNNILSINDTGQITVEASQPGDVNYNPAVPITSIINVIQAPTTLSSLSVPNKTMQDDDFYLTPVVSNRPGDIIYTSSDPQVAIVSGTLVRIIGVGDATITATQNANSKYLSAEISANFTITIGDSDGDGIVDVSDNCDFVVNPEQLDTDGDDIGDLCDPDLDGDGVTNELDNCPMDYNPDQANNDNDSSGDICDNDDDNDGYSDNKDFFPFDPNEWSDTDRDGIGNNADTDDDNDKYLDTDDAFPLNPREWIDTDGDGIGNNKDKDDDNDGVEDRRDAFPLDESEHTDTDKDGIGNNSDQDDDGDGYLDDHEIECNSDPLSRYKKPRDYDNDFIPDCIDLDDDNDGCPDEEDILPLNEKECLDTDGDGIPDGLDFDADNDGVLDFNDDFPLDPNETKDTDGDGIGDNEDRDDNNDGFPEDPILNDYDEEVIPLFVSELLTPNETGEESVWKIINIEKYPSMNVKVYNPNGIIMFESWNYQNDWTGTGKDGKPLPTGPYFYRIDRANETTVEEGWMYIFN